MSDEYSARKPQPLTVYYTYESLDIREETYFPNITAFLEKFPMYRQLFSENRETLVTMLTIFIEDYPATITIELVPSGKRLKQDKENETHRQFHFWGDAIVNKVGVWAEKIFPKSTPETVLSHMHEELAELTHAVDFYGDKFNFATPQEKHEALRNLAAEAADVQLLLFHLVYKLGINLAVETSQKFEVNKKRQWNTEPEPEGHFKHKPLELESDSLQTREISPSQKRTLCTICGINWVDADNGYDTCMSCLEKK